MSRVEPGQRAITEILNDISTDFVGSGNEVDNMPPLTDTSKYLVGLPQLPTLSSPLRNLGGISLENLVQALSNEERKVTTETALDSLKGKATERKEANEKKLQELTERVEKMKSKKILDTFTKIFKVFALVVGAIAAAATTAAGVLTGNMLLVAAGIIMIATTIDGIVSAASNGKASISVVISNLAEKCGADKKVAQWIGFAVTISLAVASAICSFGAAFVSKGAEMSTKVSAKVMALLLKSKQISNLSGGILSVGTGAATAGEAILNYQIAKTMINSKKLDAILERLRVAIEAEQDFLKMIMERYQDMTEKVKDIITENNKAQNAVLTGDFAAGQMA